MRFSRLALILLVAATAVSAYMLGIYTHQQERAVERLIARIEDNRKAIHLLEAEEAYLSRPQRLQALSNTYLTLRPPLPEQLYDNTIALPPVGVDQSKAPAKSDEGKRAAEAPL